MAYQSDPELYHRMAAPYDSEEDAQQAISAFCEEVRAARVKHRIPEVVMFCGVYHGQNMIGGAQTKGGGGYPSQ
jgi:adenylyl- and sulfurtransferase ThiI